ncbi:MAG: ribosome biogenesis GTP-binding protein YihA/YsxC [candidate division Zixibacteria bacterium]|nr:ribosome biogenesis GTP-binding protein YihA/YsxC [candidate division Zixibacteria bacterium]
MAEPTAQVKLKISYFSTIFFDILTRSLHFVKRMIRKAVFVGSYYKLEEIPADRAQVAFGGRSNVGKSSLLNGLVGQKKLARISKTPGRTQAINFFLIDDRYYFVDLPGYGFANAPHEKREEWGRLVDAYLNTATQLRGLIFLLDCRREPNEDDLMLLDWIEKKDVEFLPVLTKADKLSRSQIAKKRDELGKVLKVLPVPFSTISGIGVTEILKWIDKRVSR